MLPKAISTLLVLVGAVNVIPVLGILSAARLTELYGVQIEGDDLLILMKHRALLFGIIGSYMIYSAFRRLFQPIAFAMGFTSMLGFIAIAWQVGGYNALLQRIVVIDSVATVLLLLAVVLYLINRNNQQSVANR